MNNAITYPIPTGHGSLSQYIHTVYSIPILTKEEEYDLATKLSQDGNLEAAKKLILSHLRLVVSIARDYAGYGLNQADLIQEGNIGLMKGVKRFDPSRGVRLVSFAIHWIRAEIHEFVLRNWRLVKIATTKPQRKLFFNLRSMKKNMAALSDTEAKAIAADLGVKLKDVYEMEQRITGRDIDLIRNNDNDEKDSLAPIDWLVDYSNEPESQLHKKNERILQTTGLNHVLNKLDNRSRDIIKSRWLSDDHKTLHNLAVKYHVSPERIRQIEAKAMEKMRIDLAERE